MIWIIREGGRRRSGINLTFTRRIGLVIAICWFTSRRARLVRLRIRNPVRARRDRSRLILWSGYISNAL